MLLSPPLCWQWVLWLRGTLHQEMDSLKTLNLSLLPLSQVFQLARFLGPPSSAAVWVLMCICIGDGNAELGWDHVWMLPHFSWLTAVLEVRCECVCVCVCTGDVNRGCVRSVGGFCLFWIPGCSVGIVWEWVKTLLHVTWVQILVNDSSICGTDPGDTLHL